MDNSEHFVEWSEDFGAVLSWVSKTRERRLCLCGLVEIHAQDVSRPKHSCTCVPLLSSTFFLSSTGVLRLHCRHRDWMRSDLLTLQGVSRTLSFVDYPPGLPAETRSCRFCQARKESTAQLILSAVETSSYRRHMVAIRRLLSAFSPSMASCGVNAPIVVVIFGSFHTRDGRPVFSKDDGLG
jgi:hypothetical protein